MSDYYDDCYDATYSVESNAKIEGVKLNEEFSCAEDALDYAEKIIREYNIPDDQIVIVADLRVTRDISMNEARQDWGTPVKDFTYYNDGLRIMLQDGTNIPHSDENEYVVIGSFEVERSVPERNIGMPNEIVIKEERFDWVDDAHNKLVEFRGMPNHLESRIEIQAFKGIADTDR